MPGITFAHRPQATNAGAQRAYIPGREGRDVATWALGNGRPTCRDESCARHLFGPWKQPAADTCHQLRDNRQTGPNRYGTTLVASSGLAHCRTAVLAGRSTGTGFFLDTYLLV